MKKLALSLLCTLLFPVVGCSETSSINKYEYDEEVILETQHDYLEVKDYEILWEAMFDIEQDRYYIYIYIVGCSHCNELKNYVIGKALQQQNIYFLKGTSKDQVTTDQKNIKYAENPDDIWILGYPSLLLIANKKCTKNLAGVDQIKYELK